MGGYRLHLVTVNHYMDFKFGSEVLTDFVGGSQELDGVFVMGGVDAEVQG